MVAFPVWGVRPATVPVRADERLRHVPVIALSGFSGDEYELRAREAGSNVVLRKPCLPDDLAKAVESAARNRKDG